MELNLHHLIINCRQGLDMILCFDTVQNFQDNIQFLFVLLWLWHFEHWS